MIAVATLFTSQAANGTIAIVGATLIDGSGRGVVTDSVVLLKDDTIVAAGKRNQVQVPSGARVIDATGLVVAPGFIDAHNHSDRGFSSDPAAASQVSQGITTVVVGQDGGSPFPVGEFLQELDKKPIALNVLTFVGHATVRERVMGEDTDRLATPAEIEKMRQLVEQAMREGALGLSSGLEYETGKPASTEEVVALAKADPGKITIALPPASAKVGLDHCPCISSLPLFFRSAMNRSAAVPVMPQFTPPGLVLE